MTIKFMYEEGMDFLKNNASVVYTLASVSGLAITGVLVHRFVKKKSQPQYPLDIVILHQFPPGKTAPNLSPFVIKLETYLRMAKIPYQNDFTKPKSHKGKSPWIEYNGKAVADSEFCIEYLNKTFTIDLNSYFPREQKAIVRAFLKMAEDSLYWVLIKWRYDYDGTKSLKELMGLTGCYISCLLKFFFIPKLKNQAYHQGIGRHTKDEVLHIGELDLKALSDYLGAKKFYAGDRPCEQDCGIFGMLSQMVWCTPGSPMETLVRGDCKNLERYCFRMKQKFWPDWDERLLHL